MASPRTRRKHLGIVQLLLVTCPALGLQIFWSTLASQLAPFLRENSLPNPAIASVLLTQPLAGAILAPLLGAVMDLSHHSWGRRTPMITSGILAVLTLLGIVILSPLWIQSDEYTTEGPTNDTPTSPIVRPVMVLLVIGLGCAIQPLQLGMRCLFVDQTPSHQHSVVSAWITFLTSAGAIITFLLGSLDLHRLTRSTAFQGSFLGLGLIAACSLILTNGVALLYAREWTQGPGRHVAFQSFNGQILNHLRNTFKTLSNSSKVVYNVQAWAWMAWFPFLFYTTSFISELSLRENPQYSTLESASSIETVHASVRLGSLASLVSSVIALLSSAIVPALVALRGRNRSDRQNSDSTGGSTTKFQLWAASEAFTAIMMFSTLLAATSLQGTAIVALLGVTWAIGQWVPFTIMSCEVDRRNESKLCIDSDGTERVGATLGLYNTAISVPQIVASLLSMLVYAIANLAGSRVPTAWVLAIGGCAALRSSVIAYEASKHPLSVA